MTYSNDAPIIAAHATGPTTARDLRGASGSDAVLNVQGLKVAKEPGECAGFCGWWITLLLKMAGLLLGSAAAPANSPFHLVWPRRAVGSARQRRLAQLSVLGAGGPLRRHLE